MSNRRPGQAIAELALVMPVLILLLAATFDGARLFSQSTVMSGAAREGLRVAATGGTDAQVTAAAQAYASPIPASSVTVTVSPATRVVGQPVTVTVSTPVDVLTPVMSAITGPTVTVKGQGVMRVESLN